MAPLFMTMPGPVEWTIILVVVLLLFGGRKLPQLAKDLGTGIREFRKSVSNSSPELEEPERETVNAEKTQKRKKSRSKS
ncbi:MAG: twin-arginine translocase TatA/TatE family subunit [Leptospiraceae bacterium]